MIGNDHAWLAASGDQVRQLTSNAATGDRRVGDRGQAFARHVIDDVEHSEASAAGELVVHEVQRPARVCPCLHQIGAQVPTARRRARRLRRRRPDLQPRKRPEADKLGRSVGPDLQGATISSPTFQTRSDSPVF